MTKCEFEKFYNDYHGIAFALCYTFVRNADAAQEISHDVFLKVWEKGLPQKNKNAYFRQMLRNLCIDWLRRNKIQAAKILETTQQECVEPEEYLLSINQCIDMLLAKERTLIELNAEGYSREEIATKIGVTNRDYVSQLVGQARRKLRNLLQDKSNKEEGR